MNRSQATEGLVLDAGALIAFDRRDRRLLALLDEAERANKALIIPAGALAQAWRNGSRQALLARLINTSRTEIIPLDAQIAKAAGELCGLVGHSDVVDASVVICAAQHGHTIVTSDPHDIHKLNPHLRLIII